MSQVVRWIATASVLAIAQAALADKGSKAETDSALDRWIEEVGRAANEPSRASPGSVWSPSGRLTGLARDLRARAVNDLVTILVVERASAIAKGSTKAARSSAARSGVSALGGLPSPAGALVNLMDLGGESQLNGEGATSRETLLSTTLTARVTHVLSGGALVIEGAKDVQVNSEHQVVQVRGVIRPTDLTPGNVVRSDRLAHLEVRISGKGVVADAVRRPFFLYRLLAGLLPL